MARPTKPLPPKTVTCLMLMDAAYSPLLGGRKTLPAHAQADVQHVVVGAAADRAVVAQVELGRCSDGGGGLEADHGAVAGGRGAQHGEAVAWCPGEGGRDRPGGVGALVLPAETKCEIELALVAEADRTREIGADRGALRVGGLLRHIEVERLR